MGFVFFSKPVDLELVILYNNNTKVGNKFFSSLLCDVCKKINPNV